MPHPALPKYISPTRAACVTGMSRRHIDAAIAAGLLVAEGRVHKRIPLASLEQFIGREIDLDQWAVGEAKTERLRVAQGHYNAARGQPQHTEASDDRPQAA